VHPAPTLAGDYPCDARLAAAGSDPTGGPKLAGQRAAVAGQPIGLRLGAERAQLAIWLATGAVPTPWAKKIVAFVAAGEARLGANECEVAAGFKIAEVYGRYETSIGRRRSAASPSAFDRA
jgi:hypothetical protein